MGCFAKNKSKAKIQELNIFQFPTHEQDHKQNNLDLINLLFLVCFTTNNLT